MWAYLVANWQAILMAVYGVDLALQGLFPASSGVGGVLANIAAFLKGLVGLSGSPAAK